MLLNDYMIKRNEVKALAKIKSSLYTPTNQTAAYSDAFNNYYTAAKMLQRDFSKLNKADQAHINGLDKAELNDLRKANNLPEIK